MEEGILGEMTLTLDGTIVASSGQLENNERVSGALHEAINLLQVYKPDLTSTDGALAASTGASSQPSGKSTGSLTYKKVSFVFSDRAYLMIRSGNKILVTMKRVAEVPNIGQLMTHSNDESSESSSS